jgi:hypothetical protein
VLSGAQLTEAAISGAGRGSDRAGRVSVTCRPCGLTGAACAVPPCAEAISAAMASPRPEPEPPDRVPAR